MHSDHAFVWCLTWYINIVVGVVVAPAPSSLVAAWPRDPGVAHCPISIIILTIYYHKYSAVHTNPCLYWQRFYCHHQDIQRGLQVFFTSLLIALILHPDNGWIWMECFRRNAWFSGNPWWPVLGYHFIIPLQHQQNTDLVTWTLLRCETSEGRGEVSVTRDARRRRGERRGGECLHFCLWTGDWREDGAQRGSVWWWTVTGGTGAEQHRRTVGSLVTRSLVFKLSNWSPR